jgi:hypothetical protein
MNFGKLLAAGKSLVSGDVAGRYRMQKHIRLPKFISPRNPFKAESAEEAPPSQPLAPATMAASAHEVAPAPAPGPVRWVRWVEGVRRAAVYCVDHNPFSRIGRPKLPGIPRFGKIPVQPELSLDQVKVVRGDLTAADLEVLRVGAGPARGAGAAWRGLASRVFGGEAR